MIGVLLRAALEPRCRVPSATGEVALIIILGRGGDGEHPRLSRRRFAVDFGLSFSTEHRVQVDLDLLSASLVGHCGRDGAVGRAGAASAQSTGRLVPFRPS